MSVTQPFIADVIILSVQNYTKIRIIPHSFFQYKYEKGFVFSSKVFSGTKGNFPVGFFIWNLRKKKHLSQQEIIVDVFNTSCEKIGTKRIITRNDLLSTWVVRDKNKHILPPLSSAISVSVKTVDVRDSVADGFLCSLMSKGNDLQESYISMFMHICRRRIGSNIKFRVGILVSGRSKKLRRIFVVQATYIIRFGWLKHSLQKN